MRVRLVRRPGQPGTREQVQTYGDRLICVRYRYDTATQKRYKTVEIIVEEAPWHPEVSVGAPTLAAAAASSTSEQNLPSSPDSAARHIFNADTLVGLRPPAPSAELLRRLARAGAFLRPLLDVWVLTYEQARRLELQEYIVGTLEQLVDAWQSEYTPRSR